jgi:C1A family cysteine protease
MQHEDLTGLGRKHAPDSRDKAYILKAAAPQRGVTSRTWYVRGVLDQGATSMCVAYSGAKYLETHPVKNKLNMSLPTLYRECQRIDEWPGEDYDGTSVRALFKVLKREGYVSEYRWAWDVDTIVNHLLSTGPVVVGTNFYMGMMDSDRYDFLRPEGESVGGHAYLLIGVDTQKKCYDGSKGALRMLNSWGPRWSTNGRALISLKDMQRLLDEDGEACVATEVLSS